MIIELKNICAEIEQLTAQVRENKELPRADEAVATTVLVNDVRAATIELDVALRCRHAERRPIRLQGGVCDTNEPLSPEVRGDIDDTP